jgi:hypothetical protein
MYLFSKSAVPFEDRRSRSVSYRCVAKVVRKTEYYEDSPRYPIYLADPYRYFNFIAELKCTSSGNTGAPARGKLL